MQVNQILNGFSRISICFIKLHSSSRALLLLFFLEELMCFFVVSVALSSLLLLLFLSFSMLLPSLLFSGVCVCVCSVSAKVQCRNWIDSRLLFSLSLFCYYFKRAKCNDIGVHVHNSIFFVRFCSGRVCVFCVVCAIYQSLFFAVYLIYVIPSSLSPARLYDPKTVSLLHSLNLFVTKTHTTSCSHTNIRKSISFFLNHVWVKGGFFKLNLPLHMAHCGNQSNV